jgi:selenocysteine lyase/cysteine desulfurase
VPLGDREPAHVLAELKRRDIVCSARSGNLRLAIHFYNDEEDIARLASGLSEL